MGKIHSRKSVTYSEKSIQKNLWYFFSHHSNRFLNTKFFATGEICDFLSFLVSGYSQEVEIKISKPDFKADFKKPKHQCIINKEFTLVANRFYYAVPKDLISIDEVPEYAGLIYLDKGSVHIVKTAPLLHKNKFDKTVVFNKMYLAYEDQIRKSYLEDRNQQTIW